MKIDEIELVEWPSGCEIIKKGSSILIRSPEDAKAIIESLSKYLSFLFDELEKK